MADAKSKILVIVKGQKTDYKLMEHLLDVYGISASHEIVSYNTNIYTLYNEMFRDGDPSSVDLLQILKEHEKDPQKKELFNQRYSDVLLIFDLDPQDPQFSEEKIIDMVEFFVESSDMGMLYLNYPMVEAFYHMKSIPDSDYPSYIVTMDELRRKEYKTRVNRENRNHDYSKFAVDRSECNTVISQNIEKSWLVIGKTAHGELLPNASDVLRAQLQQIKDQQQLSVLCTCAFYIPDYNPKLIDSDN